MRRFSVTNALISAGLVTATAIVGTFATSQTVKTWYPELIKSPINPPAEVFGPAWTVLYIMMAISFYLILESPETKKRIQAIRIFFYQLTLNGLWSVAFFGLKGIFTGLLIIVALWFAIVATIYSFSQIRKSAAWLLLPYLFWVTFATYLNYSVLVLN